MEHLELGNLDFKRDCGHAKDYVEVINLYNELFISDSLLKVCLLLLQAI